MAGAGGPLRLRDWLVAQIESGRYAGLCWEDAGKTIFRIPWKHAAKQGYQAQRDAALFRAWAVYKGKHLEGADKEDPSTWKTRLRCALNKSADFCEVRERSQLDISNPYKVYRIVSEVTHNPVTKACALPEEEGISLSQQKPPGEVTGQACRTDQVSSPTFTVLSLHAQNCSGLTAKDEDKESPSRLAQEGSLPPAALLPSPLADHRYQAQDPAPSWSPTPSEDFSNPGRESKCLPLSPCFPPKAPSPDSWGPSEEGVGEREVEGVDSLWQWRTGRRWREPAPPTPAGVRPLSVPADCWLHVRLYYGAALVREATARTAEGCRLSPRAPAAAARLLGPQPRIAQVGFPEPPPGARALQRLLPHLERGVLLWVAPEGVFAKRLCQGRVYWRGPLAPHRARPNKLERERTCQLLDTRRFLAELCAHLRDGHPEPEYQIRLCFGEEYPGPPGQPEERLIMAHVEPVFARELLLHSKSLGGQAGIPNAVIHLLTHLSQP
nr:interferon regulatory factor 4-like [Loxodonta africana]